MNPYEPPQSDSRRTADSSTEPADNWRTPFRTGLLLAAIGAVGAGAWLLFQLGTEWFGGPVSFGDFLVLFVWTLRLKTLTEAVLLVGCLLCIYVPSRLKLSRYVLLAAALELLLLARVDEYLPVMFSGAGNGIVGTSIPSLVALGWFLYLFAQRYPWPAAADRVWRAGVGFAAALALSLVAGFVATAGDTFQSTRTPGTVVRTVCFASFAAAALHFAWQLVRMRSETGELPVAPDVASSPSGPK